MLGRMDTDELRIRTNGSRLTDLTPDARRFVEGRASGLLHVFAPHATAGLALLEVGAGSEQDLSELLDRIFPRDDRYVHRHGSPGHGADHLVPVLVSPSLTVPVIGGRLVIGTWQSLVLVDTNVDNPDRRVRFSFLAG